MLAGSRQRWTINEAYDRSALNIYVFDPTSPTSIELSRIGTTPLAADFPPKVVDNCVTIRRVSVIACDRRLFEFMERVVLEVRGYETLSNQFSWPNGVRDELHEWAITEDPTVLCERPGSDVLVSFTRWDPTTIVSLGFAFLLGHEIGHYEAGDAEQSVAAEERADQVAAERLLAGFRPICERLGDDDTPWSNWHQFLAANCAQAALLIDWSLYGGGRSPEASPDPSGQVSPPRSFKYSNTHPPMILRRLKFVESIAAVGLTSQETLFPSLSLHRWCQREAAFHRQESRPAAGVIKTRDMIYEVVLEMVLNGDTRPVEHMREVLQSQASAFREAGYDLGTLDSKEAFSIAFQDELTALEATLKDYGQWTKDIEDRVANRRAEAAALRKER